MAIYKEFERRRPPSTNVPDARFYLQVNRSKTPKHPGIWFKDQPMGKNTIGDIAKNMSHAANLGGRKTNHGGRRTALTTLVHAKIAPEYIAQLSGHKNVASINSYSTLSIDQQKEMSNILSGLQAPHISPVNCVPLNYVPSSSAQAPRSEVARVSEVDGGQVSFDCVDSEDIENYQNDQSSMRLMPVQTPAQVCPSVTDLPVKITEQGYDIHTAQGQPQGIFPMNIGFSGASIQTVNINYGPKPSPPVSYTKRHWKRIRLMDSQSSDE